uniref:(northern house mosquito) hypothetical protein n=1 Tax=Culex pipiens TaxID=7175 RepID=A0A8D8DFL5_CULPI
MRTLLGVSRSPRACFSSRIEPKKFRAGSSTNRNNATASRNVMTNTLPNSSGYLTSSNPSRGSPSERNQRSTIGWITYRQKLSRVGMMKSGVSMHRMRMRGMFRKFCSRHTARKMEEELLKRIA